MPDDDLRTRIAAVLLTHQHVNGKCLCQGLRERSTSGQHAQHVADAVLTALKEQLLPTSAEELGY